MYCTNCGKETSDGASFCPYCGTMIAPKTSEKTSEKVPEQAPVINRVNNVVTAQAPAVNMENRNEELPVYKRKKKGAFLVAFIPLIVAICKLLAVGSALVLVASR